MMSPDTQFGEIATFRNGLNYSRKDFGIGLHVINVGDFGDRLIPNYEDLGQINPADVAEDKDLLLDGDLLLVRSNGNPALVGRVLIIRDAPFEVGHSGFCIRARLNPDVALPEFYQYYLRCQSNRERLVSGGVGANIVNVSQNTLQRFKVPVPALNLQKKIVEVLSGYDQLININRRRISLLEKSARLLYRAWFVSFRYPGHAVGTSSGLPQGWRTRPLAEMAEVNRANLGAKDKPEEIQYIDIASVETGVVLGATKMPYVDAPGRARRLVQHGDVIWSCVRPNRCSYALLWEPDEDVIVSTGFAVLTASDVPFSYLYFATTSDEFVAYLTNRATGAAYPAVSGKDFEEAPLLCPSSEILQSFDEKCLPILELRSKLILQNAHLTEARDALLPKVMSGEIAV